MLRGLRMQAIAAAVAVLAGGSLPSASRAEVVRAEAVGVVPTRTGPPAGSPPRQAAIEAGLRDAVASAAARILDQEGVSLEPEALAEVLGTDPFSYVVSFRLLEDRGQRPRLLIPDPEVEWEYVVVVEGQLDLDRVRERLVDAGALAPPEPTGETRSIRVTVERLPGYAAYRAIRDILGEHAATVRPVSFGPGRAVLEARTSLTPGELLDALLSELPAAVTIRPLEVGEEALRLEARAGAARPRVRALFGGGGPAEPAAAGD